MTDNERAVLEAISLLLNPELQEHIQFSNNLQQNAPICISFRDKLLPGEDETFSQTIRGLALDFEKIGPALTDRLLADYGIKKKSLGKKLTSARLITAAINTPDSIDSNFIDISAFKEVNLRKLTEHQLARLLEHVVYIWNSVDADLRKPRKILDKHVRGYIKLRSEYTHDEVIACITVYGKWAKAKHDAIKNGDIDSFWFYRWDLDKFLLSNKAMSHVDAGWKELVTSKSIPEEYAHLRKAAEEIKNRDRKTEWIDKYTDRIIAGEDVSDEAHIAEEYTDEIQKVLKSKNYV